MILQPLSPPHATPALTAILARLAEHSGTELIVVGRDGAVQAATPGAAPLFGAVSGAVPGGPVALALRTQIEQIAAGETDGLRQLLAAAGQPAERVTITALDPDLSGAPGVMLSYAIPGAGTADLDLTQSVRELLHLLGNVASVSRAASNMLERGTSQEVLGMLAEELSKISQRAEEAITAARARLAAPGQPDGPAAADRAP